MPCLRYRSLIFDGPCTECGWPQRAHVESGSSRAAYIREQAAHIAELEAEVARLEAALQALSSNKSLDAAV